MKSDKKQVFADIVYFGLIYPSEKKREIQTGENHVHQGLSKVFVFFTYPKDHVSKYYSKFMQGHPREG